MSTWLTSQQFSKKSIPWTFALVGILAYGLLTPWMGFYWDDWVFVWLLEHNGPAELARSFLPYDPLVSPFFFLTSSIFGTNPFAWQVFGLAIRVAASLATYWTFNQIWPTYPRKALWAAFLSLVYPGYAQQWVAFTHANQEWISFLFFVLSLGLTARALQEGSQKKWTVYALITQFIGLATTEYFLGMEFLRPVIIWFALDGPFSKRSINTLKYWGSRYGLVWLLAGLGQYVYHNSDLYGGHSFGEGLSGGGLPNLILSMLRDIIPTLRVAAFEAWTRTFDLIPSPLSSLTDWLTLLVILAALAGLIFYFRSLRVEDVQDAEKDAWAGQAILLGLVGILGGRIPSLIAGLPLELRFDWDRLLISVLFGASLLTAGLIDYLFKDDRRKEAFISLIVALAIGMQFSQANTFRRDWQNQKNFFWQLAWRAPALKPGTALVTDELPLQYAADLQLSAPLNLVYDPQASELSYMLLYTKNRLGGSLLPKLSPNLPMAGNYRTVEFNGTTSNILLIHQPGDGCLHLLEPEYITEEAFPGLPQNLADNIDLSNIGQVERNGEYMANPAPYFGPEPERNWCYYFEKAELARQYNDWEEVISNYESASSAGYTALQPVENLVFIEALARLGHTEKAGKLTDRVISQDRKLCRALLTTWERALEASPENQTEATKQMNELSVLPECK
ncbi:MAG TPA: hypothetical protein VJ785_06300 [Anaerolineales bacterium]|nr:hypothetical protein [Anaerolineales bacterium]